MPLKSYTRMYFKLREGCFMVKGAKEAAIYDLIGGDVYAVNGRLANILAKTSNVEDIIKEALRYRIAKVEMLQYLEELITMGLGFMSNNDVYVQQIRSRSDYQWSPLEERNKISSLTCELTPECNLNCIYCRTNSPNVVNCFCGRYDEQGDLLNISEWRRTLESASIVGCENIRLIGGEPFLFSEIVQVLKYISELKFKKLFIFTNGTCIDKDAIDILRVTNASLMIPLYSYLPDIHDRVSGKAGSHSKTVGNILKLKKNNVKIIIYLFIHNINNQTVRNTASFIEDELGLEYFIDYLSPTVIKDGINYSERNINFKYRTRAFFKNIDLDSVSKRKNGNICWFHNAAVKSNGDVIPCIRARKLIIGNVGNTSLDTILTMGKFDKYWYITKDKIRKCRRCEFKYACDDCRQIALNYEGSLYARYPLCTYDPYRAVWNDLSPAMKEMLED